MSEQQSGNSNPATPVSDEDCYAAELLEHGYPLRRHKCWRFEQCVVVDLCGGKQRWRHLFACVECKRLQSLQSFC